MKRETTYGNVFRALIALMVVLGLCVAFTPAASAAENTATEGLTQTQQAELEDDLEILFTRYIQLDEDGQFEVNAINLAADGQQDQMQGLQYLAVALNEAPLVPSLSVTESDDVTSGVTRRAVTPVTVGTMGAGDFARCVALEGLGIPSAAASPGLISAIKTGIRAWNWGLTAKTVARILGPSVVKAFGGPIGIGVTLGWAAWSCRGKL